MQDNKDTLEVDDVLQPQLPWSIKRVIIWLVLYGVIGLVVIALSGLLIAYFNYANGWGLTFQDMGHIGAISLPPVLTLAFLAFLIWQCKKVDLSIKLIWGAIYPATQFRYIIYAFVFGAIVSILESGIDINFGNPPKYSSDAIFYGQIIVTGLLGPFDEELCFRGLLYRTLRKQNDSIISTLISAFIFSFFHVWMIDLTGLIFVFLVGVVTAFLLERTNSLTASFVFHAIGNLVTIVAYHYSEFLLL